MLCLTHTVLISNSLYFESLQLYSWIIKCLQLWNRGYFNILNSEWKIFSIFINNCKLEIFNIRRWLTQCSLFLPFGLRLCQGLKHNYYFVQCETEWMTDCLCVHFCLHELVCFGTLQILFSLNCTPGPKLDCEKDADCWTGKLKTLLTAGLSGESTLTSGSLGPEWRWTCAPTVVRLVSFNRRNSSIQSGVDTFCLALQTLCTTKCHL